MDCLGTCAVVNGSVRVIARNLSHYLLLAGKNVKHQGDTGVWRPPPGGGRVGACADKTIEL
jgi:hypothetical protein